MNGIGESVPFMFTGIISADGLYAAF